MMKAIDIITRQIARNTKWYINVLEGIAEKDSVRQINKNVNHMRWIAGHLLTGRYRNVIRLGLQTEPYPHLDKFVIPDTPPPNGRPVDENIRYPELAETLNYWKDYSGYLVKILPRLTDEQLMKKLPFEIPFDGDAAVDGFAFTVMHEAYHIGQMSLIRKSLGYEAMKYK
jgi:hypothetical protein